MLTFHQHSRHGEDKKAGLREDSPAVVPAREELPQQRVRIVSRERLTHGRHSHSHAALYILYR
jgi:hypothetical protein